MEKLFHLCDRFSRRGENARHLWVHNGIPTLLPNGEWLTISFSARIDGGYTTAVEINEKRSSIGKLCDMPAGGSYPLRLRPRALDIDLATNIPMRVFLEVSALPVRERAAT